MVFLSDRHSVSFAAASIKFCEATEATQPGWSLTRNVVCERPPRPRLRLGLPSSQRRGIWADSLKNQLQSELNLTRVRYCSRNDTCCRQRCRDGPGCVGGVN